MSKLTCTHKNALHGNQHTIHKTPHGSVNITSYATVSTTKLKLCPAAARKKNHHAIHDTLHRSSMSHRLL